ncbi:PEP-CTERM sorting domain-containing protein [Paucibacter sp. B2R-40]|uniref:PEP-CTERM sorting domain-containing protein n=1 Tax=Paucibacter sp. B2R-40 TaxID=2893554 RepID=UPI0021E406C7|nr:PEP-CTERM sorting domain-containing protein [Paucibacter sp. B2R-40]MCV2352750.1 PEP-CTERM sorting domain-containing protein [Paucibacter sp. B2R-40]
MQKTLLALALAAAAIAPAQAALTTGDLAFTSFNADEDGFSLVTLVGIDVGTNLYFSDNEWNGLAIGNGGKFIDANEGSDQWVTSAYISAGTVLRFSNIDKANASATGLKRVGTGLLALGNSNETVYAFLGSSTTAPTTFLAAITNGGFALATDGVLTNTGLTVGTSNGIRLNANNTSTTPDYGVYAGVRSGQTTFDGYKALIGDVSNWTVDTTNGTYTTTVPDTTAFTVAAAVPEPQTYAMLLAGLAAVGFVARRRAAK